MSTDKNFTLGAYILNVYRYIGRNVPVVIGVNDRDDEFRVRGLRSINRVVKKPEDGKRLNARKWFITFLLLLLLSR